MVKGKHMDKRGPGMPDKDKDGIMQTLQCFFSGFDAKDGAVVKQAFHPQAFLFNASEKEAAQGIPIQIFCDNFLPFIKANPEHPWNSETCEKEVLMIDSTGDAAVAKVAWRFSFLVMTDYYTLMRLDGKWLITGKVWHYEELA